MPVTVEDVLAGLDIPAIKQAVRGTFMGKYGVSLRYDASEAIAWARAFGLGGREPCRVLDIACGSAIFARVCTKMGHGVTGVDQPGYMHADLANLMGVDFVEHFVEAADPLPAFPSETFDVVTMMHISNHEGDAFYKALAGAVWTALKPGGQWWIVFHSVNSHLSRDQRWAEWFKPAGRIATRGSRVLLLEKPL